VLLATQYIVDLPVNQDKALIYKPLCSASISQSRQSHSANESRTHEPPVVEI